MTDARTAAYAADKGISGDSPNGDRTVEAKVLSEQAGHTDRSGEGCDHLPELVQAWYLKTVQGVQGAALPSAGQVVPLRDPMSGRLRRCCRSHV
jgi:hypothetical protein